MSTQEERACFVICPIGDRHAHLGTAERIVWEDSIETWEKVIRPACQEVGLQPVRADHITESGEIPEQVCRHLRTSDLVIADLTGGNANVMYELGLRHTTGLPTAQIGERGRLPFDVSAIRTIMFVRTEGGLISARRELAAALKSLLAGEGHPVTATRVWLSEGEAAPGQERAAEPDDLGENDEEPGYLEKLAEAEVAMTELAGSLGPVTAAMGELGNIWSDAAEQARRSDASGGGASAKLAIAERTASRTEGAATSFQEGVDDVARILHRVAPGMDYLLQRIEEGLEDQELPQEFTDALMTLGDTVESNQAMFAGFLSALGDSGYATRSLKRINLRISSEIKRFMELSEVLVGWRDRLREALDNKT